MATSKSRFARPFFSIPKEHVLMAEQSTSIWRPRDAWGDVAKAARIDAPADADVTAVALSDLGLATLITAGSSADLDGTTKRLIGLDLPRKPFAALSGTHGLVWSGPDQWLLVARQRAGFGDLLAS